MHNNIVVIRYSALGDIILAIPTVNFLVKLGFNVHWIIHEKWKDISYYLPANVYYYNGIYSLLRLGKELANIKPLAVLDLQNKFTSRALTVFLKAFLKNDIPSQVYKKRFLREQIKVFLDLYPFRFKNSKPVFFRYFEVAKKLLKYIYSTYGRNKNNDGFNYSTKYNYYLANYNLYDLLENCNLEVPSQFLSEARKLLKELGIKEKQFIVLHPYASYIGKEMPINALNYLYDVSWPWDIIIVGNVNESEDVSTKTDIKFLTSNTKALNTKLNLLRENLRLISIKKSKANIYDLTNKVELRLLPALLVLSRGVISTDSAPMHIARAVNVPTIGIYFQTDPILGFVPFCNFINTNSIDSTSISPSHNTSPSTQTSPRINTTNAENIITDNTTNNKLNYKCKEAFRFLSMNDIQEFQDLMIISKKLDCKPCSLHGQRYNCVRNNHPWECKNLNWIDIYKKAINFISSFGN